MLNSFLSIYNDLKNNKLRLKNDKFNRLLLNYEFSYIKTKLDLEQNQIIRQNLKESKVVIINQDEDQNLKTTDKFFIICFQRTLILINLSSLSILHSFFSINPDLTFYYLSNTKEFFPNFPKESIIDNNFKEEILSLKNEFLFQHNNKNMIPAWPIIQTSISAYLIKQSYSKLKKDRIRNFSSFLQQQEETNQKVLINKNEFIFLRLIGLGAEFKVELFYYIEGEELVAIKESNLINKETEKLKNRELTNYYNELNHPFLPKFYGITEEDENIIIEFINGKTLFDIKEMNLTDDEKFTIIFELMITVEFLHRKNFIIRDLKPNNIMIDELKNIVLIDFDRMLSMNEEILEFSNQFSSIYVAPEVNTGNFSNKCDIYSIGLIIYYIMNERIPTEDNFNECFEFKGYSKLFNMFLNCINDNPENRKPLSELIFSFFIDFYSKIKIENLFSKFDGYFSNVYTDYKLKILKTITLNDNSEAYLNYGLSFLTGKEEILNINKAIKYLSISAEKNNSNAQYLLGEIYDKDEYLLRDMNKAIKYYKLAANQNNEKAQMRLGEIYENEKDYKDINKSIEFYTLAADQENEEAMYRLGYIFENVLLDINKAIEYYTLAAYENHIKSLFNLGIIYEKGKGIKADIKKAIHYFTFAANQQDIQSLNHLGQIFLHGKKIKANIKKAIHYFTLASKLNDDKAQFTLGYIYENIYEPHDYKKAIKYYTLSAKQNNTSAQVNLGMLYEEGKKVKLDIKKSIHYYQLAAEKNDKQALYRLGIIYEKKIVPPIYNKAIEYYTSSANQNYCLAQLKLGNIYSNSKIVKNNLGKAFYYYTLAAKQNNPEAQFHLGMIYQHDKNDLKTALYFYRKSANQDYLIAKLKLQSLFISGEAVPQNSSELEYLNLDVLSFLVGYCAELSKGDMYYEGKECPKDIEKAIYYYKIASEKNCVGAHVKLAYIYLRGYDVPRDIYKAIHYFKLASDKNDSASSYNLGTIYSHGTLIPCDIEKAIHYYSITKGEFYPNAQFNLGCIYFYGNKKIQKNVKKAIDYFQNAAKYNFPEAQYMLGVIYYKGEFAERNYEKAIHYITLSAKQDFPQSQFALGFIYYNHFNDYNNIQKGVYWLELSSKNHCKVSYFIVGYIYHEGKNVVCDIHKAISLYKEASNNNNQYAKNNLGIIYKNGFGDEIKKNIFLAIEYFKEAIKIDHCNASIFNLASLYFYEKPIKNSIDESIKLLIELALKMNNDAILLLCLALVKKFGNNMKLISDNIISYTGKSSDLPFKICNIIKSNNLFNKSVYKKEYILCKTFDCLYKYDKSIIHIFDFMRLKTNIIKSKAINITSDFYEGFGHDLLNC